MRLRRQTPPLPKNAEPASLLVVLALPVGLVAAIIVLVTHGLVHIVAWIVCITALIYIAAAGFRMRQRDRGTLEE